MILVGYKRQSLISIKFKSIKVILTEPEVFFYFKVPTYRNHSPVKTSVSLFYIKMNVTFVTHSSDNYCLFCDYVSLLMHYEARHCIVAREFYRNI